jgi:hypothetical protein
MNAKLKFPYVDRLNPKYGAGNDKKKQTAEAFETLNAFVRRNGGTITSPPGKFVRIECPRDSELPAKLTEMGFDLVERGETMRVAGSTNYATRLDELMNGAPSPFSIMRVYETTLGGK